MGFNSGFKGLKPTGQNKAWVYGLWLIGDSRFEFHLEAQMLSSWL